MCALPGRGQGWALNWAPTDAASPKEQHYENKRTKETLLASAGYKLTAPPYLHAFQMHANLELLDCVFRWLATISVISSGGLSLQGKYSNCSNPNHLRFVFYFGFKVIFCCKIFQTQIHFDENTANNRRALTLKSLVNKNEKKHGKMERLRPFF